MTAADILNELEPLGNENYKQIMLRHFVKEPVFGVKIEYMKRIIKRIGHKHYKLALDLYDTGVYDARYMAGLIADETKMTKKDLEHWLKTANCPGLTEFTVPWVAAESKYGHELAMKWIEAKNEGVAAAGWATLSGLVALKDDDDLDLDELKKLLDRVQKTIHAQPDRVRYVMNGFVVAVGSYVKALTKQALQAAAKIGTVTVDMHGTDCKVPPAADYIKKVEARGAIGKKKKTVRC
jgi:3-methyladenine DNA glycosylase AlkD